MSDSPLCPSASSSPRGRTFGLLPSFVIIAATTLLSFLPSLKNGFTNWDDNTYITENPDLSRSDGRGVIKIATSTYAGNFHPLTMLACMAEYRFFRLDPAPYHRVNLLIHLVNALLVCALLRGLCGSSAAALAGGLLFAVHPLRVESVAWVAELKDVLCGFFYFLSLLRYRAYAASGRCTAYWSCFAAFAAALLAKPMAVSLPIALLLIDYVTFRPGIRQCLREKIPFIAVAAFFCLVTVGTQRSAGALNDHASLHLLRFCIPFYGILFYAVKTAVPFHLSALYFFPDAPDALLKVELLLSPLVLLGAALLLRRVRMANRAILFGMGFFTATLLPVLQVISAGPAVVADRYSYIPSVGLCSLFGIAVAALDKRLAGDRLKRLLPVVLTAAVAGGLALVTFNRCGVWHDGVTLWTDCIVKSPNPVAFHNRGCAYAGAGRPDRAIADFTTAITLLPSYASAWYDRGSVYLSLGDPVRAVEDLTEAFRLNPHRADARNNRGIAYLEEKNYDAAAADFSGAIGLKPGFADAYSNRGIANMEEHRYDAALADFDKAIAINSGFVKAWQGRAVCMKTMKGKW
jgi:tetratricopeptide (TPR) repeat protein